LRVIGTNTGGERPGSENKLNPKKKKNSAKRRRQMPASERGPRAIAGEANGPGHTLCRPKGTGSGIPARSVTKWRETRSPKYRLRGEASKGNDGSKRQGSVKLSRGGEDEIFRQPEKNLGSRARALAHRTKYKGEDCNSVKRKKVIEIEPLSIEKLPRTEKKKPAKKKKKNQEKGPKRGKGRTAQKQGSRQELE